MTFEELGLHPLLLKAIHDLGFQRPTPIQAQAIPPVLEGRDLIGCAQTGTGKTAAFSLPILHRFITHPQPSHAIRSLVLTPTRELCQQVMEDVKELSKHSPVTAASIFGGVGMDPQVRALKAGTPIIVATPGRLLDHMNRGYVNFKSLEVLVLDEADRMLDMGFLPDIRRILGQLPVKRQTLFFSATMPGEIQSLVNQITKDAVKVQVEVRQTAAVGITHAVYPVSQGLKNMLLRRLLTEKKDSIRSVLIFCRTKHHADSLDQVLKRDGFKVGILHSDRTQSQRTQALEHFRDGYYQILVATDIAARGLDIDGISHVINFDVPNTAEDYIHRVGRTARAETVGDAFTLMSREEEHVIRAVEFSLGKPIPRVTLPDFPYHVIASPSVFNARRREGGGPGGRPQRSGSNRRFR